MKTTTKISNYRQNQIGGKVGALYITGQEKSIRLKF